MLKSHISAKEATLLSQYKETSISGHPTLQGSPREIFVKHFLREHLNSNVSIGSGEIIDASSKPGERRNQHDIVIYKKNYPKLNFGGDTDIFLVESVIATIEVKSTLDQSGIDQAVQASSTLKKYRKHLSELYVGHRDYYAPFCSRIQRTCSNEDSS